ncbi:hypothetical protein [Rhizobium sp. C1]|uniref:hypothetical protein n=1 Tax=Rhizobium sp. C1 TaxID=1349799 RepID=UPI001E525DDD|nr:hypothetical protein [Rhizobium sp. C1]MCD2180049.1 hypothetical protein [Rhizobium sp. C1]
MKALRRSNDAAQDGYTTSRLFSVRQEWQISVTHNGSFATRKQLSFDTAEIGGRSARLQVGKTRHGRSMLWTSKRRSVIRISQSQGFRLGERYIFAALEQNLLLLLA